MNSSELSSRDPEGEVDFIVLWRVLWSYKYLIALIAGLFVAVAVVLALTATSIYRAEVVIVESSDSNASGVGTLTKRLGGLAGLAGIDLGSSGGNGANAMAILKSRRLVEEFIQRNKLLATLYPRAKRPPTLWYAVTRFRTDVLSFRDDKRGNTTTLAINWTDPVIAAAWANGFVALANDVIRTRSMEDSKRNIAYLNDQIAHTTVIEVQRVMYGLIENEIKTLMLASGREEYAFTVVDPAVAPEVRLRPQRTSMVVFGGLLGLLAGVGAAFVHNSLRARKQRKTQNPA